MTAANNYFDEIIIQVVILKLYILRRIYGWQFIPLNENNLNKV